MANSEGFFYSIQRGDTLSRLAQKHKLRGWEEIYYHKENDSFRSLRPNPNLIYPDDRVWIPERQPSSAGGKTGEPIPLIKKRYKMNALEWFEYNLISQGAASGGTAVMAAERVFYLPEIDAATKIAEGPTAATSWEGYHAGKHGLWERFGNFKGEEVNMGELFFNEKYRWIYPVYKDAAGNLKNITDQQFRQFVESIFEKPSDLRTMRGVLDSEAFTRDVRAIFEAKGGATEATIWQGKYTNLKGYVGDLQTNVDFRAAGHNWRIAVDAETGQILNFFRIENNPKYPPMKFIEIVIKWKGKITDVTKHVAPNSTLTVETSATWTGLLKQGVKTGTLSGGLVSGFLGGIDGFKKEGIPGALKGLSIGMIIGGGIGGALGGAVALAQRVMPWVGKVVKVGGFFVTVFAILLDPSETGLDPQEWASGRKDDDGNIWAFRNIWKVGSIFFPEYVPHGVRVDCTDGTHIEMGDEMIAASSYHKTPITWIASRGNPYSGKEVKWMSVFTPEGSRMWWWQEKESKEEHILSFRDKSDEDDAIAKFTKEEDFRI